MNPAKCKCGASDWTNNYTTATMYCNACHQLWTYEALEAFNATLTPLHQPEVIIKKIEAEIQMSTTQYLVQQILANQIAAQLDSKLLDGLGKLTPIEKPWSYEEHAASEFNLDDSSGLI